jgi:hypothetical protein
MNTDDVKIRVCRKVIPIGPQALSDDIPADSAADTFGLGASDMKYEVGPIMMSVELPNLPFDMDQLFAEPVAGMRVNGIWFKRASAEDAVILSDDYLQADSSPAAQAPTQELEK